MDAMSWQSAKTFCTDQALAIFKPIQHVFSNTWYHLWQWHINRNASSHMSGKALHLFRKCMCYVKIENELEQI